MADVDALGTPIRTYTYGPGIDNLIAMTVHSSTTNQTFYTITDPLGTVHTLVDETGTVMDRYTYDAWGNVQGSEANQHTVENRFLFQGREYSFATGLYNFRARWYDPQTGRWLSNDPIGISGGLNLYAFCGNNPVMYRDPMGLCVEDGNAVLKNIRTFYDALEMVARDKWWISDRLLKPLALLSLSGGTWGPLDFKYQNRGPFKIGNRIVQGDYFGNYVAGYQAGYGNSPGLLTGVFLGGQLWAAFPGDEPAGDIDSIPAITDGYLAGRDARKNK